jgi:uncharacterized membrane protein YeaQ/YmgE (transglycosylase-associated protein family)
MNIIVWLIVGGVVGWGASLVMGTDARQGIILNVIVGVLGAALGGWLLSPMVGVSTINQGDFSIGRVLVSLIGAIALLAIVGVVRRFSAR